MNVGMAVGVLVVLEGPVLGHPGGWGAVGGVLGGGVGDAAWVRPCTQACESAARVWLPLQLRQLGRRTPFWQSGCWAEIAGMLHGATQRRDWPAATMQEVRLSRASSMQL